MLLIMVLEGLDCLLVVPFQEDFALLGLFKVASLIDSIC